MTDRSKLTTEQRNPRTTDIDRRSTVEIVELINSEDALVPQAVGSQQDAIAAAVDLTVAAMRDGGRLFYVGAGTSGRLGVLDASECPPTFGTRPSLVQGIIAGGRRALVRSVEGAEDHTEDGAAALEQRRVGPKDVVVGIAACGITPFVLGAMVRAREIGAATVFVTCAPEGIGNLDVDVIINPVVGPEVVTGSTRMKAGTATKLVLNTLTTAAMIKLGKVYGNLMVDLNATNEKLRDRAQRIVMDVTGLDRGGARNLLERAGWRTKVAAVMHAKGVDRRQALAILKQSKSLLSRAIGEDT